MKLLQDFSACFAHFGRLILEERVLAQHDIVVRNLDLVDAASSTHRHFHRRRGDLFGISLALAGVLNRALDHVDFRLNIGPSRCGSLLAVLLVQVLEKLFVVLDQFVRKLNNFPRGGRNALL